MKLMTKELEAALPRLYATEDVKVEDKVAVVKFFFPAGRATWYAVEGQPEDDGDFLFFGYVVSPLGPDCDEWGYFSLRSLQGFSVHGLRVERDLHFSPTKVSELCLGVLP